MPTYREPYFGINVGEDPIVASGLTETRVHGVSGATPEQLLNDPHPMIVTGDNLAAFYRQRRNGPDNPHRTVEAYSWSGLNSRASARAFWLLLFPFGMINFAGWMLPELKRGHKPIARAVVRLLGVVATAHYALWAMVISVDLLAVQCGESQSCRELGWLGWLRRLDQLLDNSLTRRMIVLSALPFALLALLAWLGRRTRTRYDEYKVGGTLPRPAADKRIVDDLPLRDARFWRTAPLIDAQALFHLAAAAAMVGAILTLTLANDVLPLLHSPRAESIRSSLREIGPGLLVLSVSAIIGVVTLGASKTHEIDEAQPYSGFRAVAWGLIVMVAILTLCTAFQALQLNGRPAEATPLDTLRYAFRGILLTELVLVVILCAFVYARMAFACIAIGPALFWALTGPSELAGYKIHWWQPTLLSLAAAATMLWIYRNRWSTRPPPNPSDHIHNSFKLTLGVAFLILLAIVTIRSQGSNLPSEIVALLIPIVFLLLAFSMQLRRGHDYPPSWKLRGGGPAVVAAVGTITLALISSAFIVLIAQRLRAPDPISGGTILQLSPKEIGPKIEYYEELGWIAATGVGAGLVLLTVLVVRICSLWLFRWRKQVTKVNCAYDTDPSRDGPNKFDEEEDDKKQQFARRAARARMWAALIDDADWLLMAGVMAFLAGAISFLLQTYYKTAPTGVIEWIIGYSAPVLVTIASLSIVLVMKTRTDAGLRRSVGIMWEVTSFFPRRFHPLCPPCYAERSVPELRNRLVQLTQRNRGALLVAHSQGTLICTAALLLLLENDTDKTCLRRIAWVSYGCMLRRLFGRGYPSFVIKKDLVELKAALEELPVPADGSFPKPKGIPHWMNFCRHSDYLGGRVFTNLQLPPEWKMAERDDDVIFGDPTRRWRFRGQPEHARMWRHSFDYTDDDEDPRFRSHIERLIRDMNHRIRLLG